MNRFNEHASPVVASRRIQAIQILRKLYRLPEHAATKAAILKDLGFDEGDLSEIMENLMQEAIDNNDLEECGCCEHYHRPDFRGDCRNDDERFPGW